MNTHAYIVHRMARTHKTDMYTDIYSCTHTHIIHTDIHRHRDIHITNTYTDIQAGTHTHVNTQLYTHTDIYRYKQK